MKRLAWKAPEKAVRAPAGLPQLLLLGVWAAGCLPFGDGADDAWLLSVAATAVEADSAVGAVWPGFWPADQPFALWPFRGGVLLVAADSPGTAVTPVRGEDVPAPLTGRAYLLDDTLRASRTMSFDAAYRVDDLTVPGVGTLPTAEGLGREDAGDRTLLQLQFLYHEAFHGYQESVFTGRGGRDAMEEPFIDPVEVWEPEFRAHAALERRILADALMAGDPAEVRTRARSYLAARGARLASLPARREAESLVERKEGSAQLVGYQAALIAQQGTATGLPALLREHLMSPNLDEGADAVDAYRTQLYATGAAIGVILDRLGVAWREAMEEGRSFPELLAPAVDAAWPATEPVPAAVREAYGYDRLLARASELRWEDPVAAVAAYDGPTVVVVGLRVRSSRYAGRSSKPERGVEVYHEGTTLRLEGDGVVVESEGRVVVADRRSGPGRYTVHVPSLPAVNGAVPSSGRVQYDGARIEGEGLTIAVEGPVMVEREGDVLTVRLR